MNIVAGEGKTARNFGWSGGGRCGGEGVRCGIWGGSAGEGGSGGRESGGGRAGEGEVGGLGDADPFPVDLNTGDKHGSASQFCI